MDIKQSGVIECDKNGRIKGIQSGGYADITCKSKWNTVSDTIRVYCVKPLTQPKNSGFVKSVTSIYCEPNTNKLLTFYFYLDLSMFFHFLTIAFTFLNSSNSISNAPYFFIGGKCKIMGTYDSFCYIRLSNYDGFVKYTALKEKFNQFLNLSATDMDVWGDGVVYSAKTLSAIYEGEVDSWTVADESIATYDETTKQVVCHKPGTTTITASADGMTATCTIHSLYKWPQTWTGKTNKTTNLYKAEGSEYKSNTSISESKEFIVYGDTGGSDGWAYGNVKGTTNWGYVPIEDISAKGTISQYNDLNWTWPVDDIKNGESQTAKARYITSPYGWRDTDPERHRGIDITAGPDNEAGGYEVVSAFAGTVIYVYDISSGYKSCGNCVAIRSDEKDPVTGQYFVAIYMHLKSKPEVNRNQKIPANFLLGYVGNTGKSNGSHLHFEVNNQNLSYGQKLYYDEAKEHEKVFSIVINPVFFYMDEYNLPEGNSEKITINPTCEAMNYRKPFWYGDDVKETKEP